MRAITLLSRIAEIRKLDFMSAPSYQLPNPIFFNTSTVQQHVQSRDDISCEKKTEWYQDAEFCKNFMLCLRVRCRLCQWHVRFVPKADIQLMLFDHLVGTERAAMAARSGQAPWRS